MVSTEIDNQKDQKDNKDKNENENECGPEVIGSHHEIHNSKTFNNKDLLTNEMRIRIGGPLTLTEDLEWQKIMHPDDTHTDTHTDNTDTDNTDLLMNGAKGLLKGDQQQQEQQQQQQQQQQQEREVDLVSIRKMPSTSFVNILEVMVFRSPDFFDNLEYVIVLSCLVLSCLVLSCLVLSCQRIDTLVYVWCSEVILLLLPNSMSSGASESPDLLQSYSVIKILLHNAIILITLTSFNHNLNQ
mgnify:CR=1 FL=1